MNRIFRVNVRSEALTVEDEVLPQALDRGSRELDEIRLSIDRTLSVALKSKTVYEVCNQNNGELHIDNGLASQWRVLTYKKALYAEYLVFSEVVVGKPEAWLIYSGGPGKQYLPPEHVRTVAEAIKILTKGLQMLPGCENLRNKEWKPFIELYARHVEKEIIYL